MESFSARPGASDVQTCFACMLTPSSRARVRGSAGYEVGGTVGLDWPGDAEVELQD